MLADVECALIGFADARLAAAMRAAATQGPVVVLTDDRDLLPAIDGVTVVEPEDLIPDGTNVLGKRWDPDVAAWLLRLFGSERLARLMSVELQSQPEFTERNLAVSVSRRFFDRFRPRTIRCIGHVPSMFAVVPIEAQARGIDVRPASQGWRRWLRWPAGVAMTAAMMARHSIAFARRVRGRQRARRRLSTVALDQSLGEPLLWLGLSPTWYQSSRHVIETLLMPLDRRRTPYGIVFIETFGEPPFEIERNSDEMSLFDGRLAQVRPVAVDQATGVESWPAALGVWLRWVPLAAAVSLRAIANVERFVIGELPAWRPGDLRRILSVATQGLLRLVDAERAAADWCRRHRSPRLVTFSHAPAGSVKVFDELLQERGTTTVDFAHGSASEANLRTMWRSSSTYHVAWTLQERDVFAEMGTNRVCLGGYMPRLTVATRSSRPKPRVLAVTAYFHKYWLVDGRLTTAKHGRRLAAQLLALAEHLGDRAEVVLRPHPHEDRQPWLDLFAGHPRAPRLSTIASLTDDLAESDIVLSTKSSACIEAWAAGLPVLFHRGPFVDPQSLYWLIPDERWFSTAAELCAKVDALLEAPDLEPERRLLEACFGPERRPRSILPLIDELLGDGAPASVVNAS